MRELLAIFFLFFCIQNSYSQVIFGDSTKLNSTNLQECGQSDSLILYVRNASGTSITNVSITDSLNSKLSFVGLASNSAINNFSYTNSVLKINLNNLADNEIVRIIILVRLKCNVLNSSNSLSSKLNLEYNDGINKTIFKQGVELISTINAPSLIIYPIGNNDNSNALVNQFYTRKWKVINNRVGSVADTFLLKIAYQNGLTFQSLKINGLSVSPIIIGDTISYRIILKLRDNNNFPNDSILIEESYNILSCFSTSGSSRISIFYGCFENKLCKEFFQTSSVQTQVTVPDIVVLNTWLYGCKNGYDTLVIRMINKGGVARNVNFDVNSSYSDYLIEGGSIVSYFDSSSSEIKKGKNGVYTKFYKSSSIQYSYSRSYWPITRPSRLINYNIPSINAGDTVYFKILHFNPCLPTSECRLYEKSINTAFTYQNNCLNNNYLIKRTNIRHERMDADFKIEGPTDLINSDTGKFLITFAPNSSTGFRYDVKGYLVLEIKYSVGLKWIQNNNDLILSRLSSTATDSPDSVFYDPTNRTIQAFYKYNQSAIGVATTRSSYSIIPKFVLDCPAPSNGFVSIKGFDKRDFSCGTNCLEMFGCEKVFPVVLHCPSPCPRGGVSPINAIISRTTFGLPDNNQDGIPDISGGLDFSKIEINKVVALDTFVLKYRGVIVRGGQSPTQFTFGYGESIFPTIGYLVQGLKGSIKIKDASTNTSFVVNNLSFTTTNSGNNRTFKWNYSSNLAGFPSGYIFDDQDSIEVSCFYVFNPSAINYGTDLTNTVSNNFYVSNLNNPTNDTAKYRCDIFNSLIKTVTTYYTVYNPDNFIWNGCGSYVAYYRAYLSIGECCSNYNGSIHFPYEYRSYGFWDSLRVVIPDGLKIDSANLYFSNGTKVGNTNSFYRWTAMPVSSNSKSNLYDIGKYFTPRGGNIIPSRGGFYGHVTVYFKPTCNAPNTIPFARPSNYGYQNINTWQNRVNYISTDPSPGNQSWSRINDYSSGSTVFYGPSLDISNIGSVAKVFQNKKLSWSFRIQNNSNTSNSDFTFLYTKSKSGLIQIDSIKDSNTGLKISKVGDFYRLGKIAKNASGKNFQVYVNQTACNRDSIILFTGWSCDAYPTVLNNAVCFQDSIKMYVSENISNLSISTIQKPANIINLCDTLKFNVEIKQLQNIYLGKVFFDVQLPNLGVGMSLLENKSIYIYPYNAFTEKQITPINLGGGLYRYLISDSNQVLKVVGMKGFDSIPKNGFRLKFNLLTNCDFVSGTEIKLIAQGENVCGQTVPNDIYYQKINIFGAPVKKLHFSSTLSKDIKPCNTNVELSVKLRNLQSLESDTNDNLYLTLPIGVLYKNNSVSFSRNPFSDTVPSISYIGNRQVLRWTADKIPVSDSSIVKILIYSPSNIPCGNNPILEIETRSKYKAVCAQNNCISQVQNNLEKIQTVIRKPNIVFVSGEANIVQDTTAGNVNKADTLNVVSLSFSNIGNDTGNLFLNFFYDANHNNVFESNEIVFYKDSIKNFVSSSIRKYSQQMIFGHRTLPDTLKVFGFVNCNCNNNNFVITPDFKYTPLEENKIELFGRLIQNISNLWFENINASYIYIVERKLTDEVKFKEIGRINNFNNYILDYQDQLLGECNSYDYRIKALLNNGITFYSNTVSLSNCSKPTVQITPNPANDMVKLSFSNLKTNDLSIELIDGIGKEMDIEFLKQDTETILFNVQTLAPGVYFIKLHNERGFVEIHKLVVY